jgi:hypothetical protein
MLSFPKKSIAYLFICGLGLVAIFLITFYSNYRALNKLDNNIKELKAKIESQNIFQPLFQELFKKIQFKQPEGLTFPKPAKLSQEDAGKISPILQKIAVQNNLKIEEIVPDVDSSIDGSMYLMINITMLGELIQLREFLFQLGGIPYLAHIEQIQIQTVEGAKEFRLKVWMAKE